MKKLLIAVLVFYFGVRMTASDPTVFISIVVGPFQTLSDCNIAYNEAVEIYKALFGDDFTTVKCNERIAT